MAAINYSKMDEKSILRLFMKIGGVIFALLILSMFFILLKESFPAIKRLGLSFFTAKEWNPVAEKFSILPFVAGTFITTLLSLVISIPFSLSIAIFSGIYMKETLLGKIVEQLTDLLSGVPSVIYGFWGLFFLVPKIRELEISINAPPYGAGILTASIVLSIMIIPYTSSIAREVIKLIPIELVEGGYSLGASSYDVIRKIVFPYAKSGIFAGILLSFGRAFGETMAVTMVIGNSNVIPETIFSPANTMASLIANEFTEATKDIHLSALIEIGLILFILSFIINYTGNKIIKKFEINKDNEKI